MNTRQTIALIGFALLLVLLLTQYELYRTIQNGLLINSYYWRQYILYGKIRHYNMSDISPPALIASTGGGLGNQFFRFACCYSLSKKLGIPLYVAINEKFNKREFILDKFSIPMNQVDDLGKYLNDTKDEIVYTINDKHIVFNEITSEIVSTKMIYHHDFCQSELFFREHKDVIRRMFVLEKDPAESNPWVRHWLRLIKNYPNNTETTINSFSTPIHSSKTNSTNTTKIQTYESVAIHIRRGDFIQSWLTPMRFFRLAMIEMIEKLEKEKKIPQFFIFSDSVENVTKSLFNVGTINEELGIEINDTETTNRILETLTSELYMDLLPNLNISTNVLYVSNSTSPENTELSVEEEFYLITKCHHMIVSYSTFSWWGAYLLENKNKTIIRPKINPGFYKQYQDDELQQMFKKVETEKYFYPKEWIMIDPFFK